MLYYKPEKDEKGLYLTEDTYDPRYALKTESVFAQCNGYFGVRASFDCRVLNESRGMFVGGFYHRANENEVTELVNCPDLTEIQLILDGKVFSLDRCVLEQFKRRLNLLTGELEITAVCELKSGAKIKLESKRFASVHNCHLYCQTFSVTPLNQSIKSLEFISGINGQITNSGISHFRETECRVFEKKIMSLEAFLEENSVRLFCGIDITGGQLSRQPEYTLRRRSIYETNEVTAEQNQTVCFSKYSYIGTAQEEEAGSEELTQMIRSCMSGGYQKLYEEQKSSMEEFWKYARIEIDGASPEEEAAICFSQYQLMGMAPRNTSAYSVAAKGLTGEGYKGHVFWDTELFVLPFFLYLFPEQARNLLIYRFNSLPKAREKAALAGYEGAMFPWEAAKDGQEETPPYAQLNIHTGKANRVWSGLKENHVTADIAYAVWNYYTLTDDREFMRKYGIRIVLEAAIFWVSRAEYNPDGDRYVIRNIIGPDEYDEHIDNNAYTNYMAYFCVKIALRISEFIKNAPCAELRNLASELGLENQESKWRDFVGKIYLPKPNAEEIIPQDDTFLQKKELPDIERYKSSKHKQSILLDYSRDEVVDMQVLKQADIVMLFTLLPDFFSDDVIKKNLFFYEERTIHDSSLSYCAHAQVYANMGYTEEAMEFFQKALEIDINDNPFDSSDGIHSASLGGVWLCAIRGFAGISHRKDTLKISPSLPESWNSMKFCIKVRHTYLNLEIMKSRIVITCETPPDSAIPVEICGRKYKLKDSLSVDLTP